MRGVDALQQRALIKEIYHAQAAVPAVRPPESEGEAGGFLQRLFHMRCREIIRTFGEEVAAGDPGEGGRDGTGAGVGARPWMSGGCGPEGKSGESPVSLPHLWPCRRGQRGSMDGGGGRGESLPHPRPCPRPGKGSFCRVARSLPPHVSRVRRTLGGGPCSAQTSHVLPGARSRGGRASWRQQVRAGQPARCRAAGDPCSGESGCWGAGRRAGRPGWTPGAASPPPCGGLASALWWPCRL